MPDAQITYSETDTKGRYAVTFDGVEGEAYLTTSKLSAATVIADGTVVPDNMRGMGAGAALAERLIADARTAGQKIVPLCPFLRAYAEKHRDALSDVIQW
ncbi:N-acetyltransferase [Rhodobacteraceae bacterium R_SAG7]|nr:N-acetyltransferase [Rhodobacteraceae bacterium R_SAG7]